MTPVPPSSNRLRFFSNWRWMAVFLLVLFAVSYLLFQTLLSIFVEYADQQRHASLREKVRMARSAIEPTLRDLRTGTITKTQAIEKVQALLNTLTFEDEFGLNYIFLNTTDGTVLVRPYRPQDVGKNMIDIQDSTGKYYMRELPTVARANSDGGFCRYQFPHPGTQQDEEKLSFALLVPELDAVLGTGSYMSKATQAKVALLHRAFGIGLCLYLLFGLPLLVSMYQLQRQNVLMQQEIEQRHRTEQELVRNE
ncbi:MAG TPA: cache domain-containing protein, partial [Candidatus Ozemobacteraceae bacterium]|nr:cache domain-containing protein [Candidatus Ozemobacteraceae bacterium]